MTQKHETTDAVDPTTVEIVRNQLHDIAEEMQAIVMQSAYSPLWQEGGDLSCTILNPDAEIVGQSARAIPIHIATQMSATRAAIEQTGGYDELDEGDLLFHNDPYSGNNHLNDFIAAKPVFVDDVLVGFAANRGHWVDVGGSSPSSYSTDTGEIIQEGIRVPPVKLYENDRRNDPLYETLLSNVRNAGLREADFKAQLAGVSRGHERLTETAEKYGARTARSAMESSLATDEHRMREKIAALPDGRYTAEDYIDGDGVTDEIRTIRVAVTVDGDSIDVDFEGTDDQVFGGVNSPFGVTKTAAYYASKVTIDPGDPDTSGVYRPIRVRAPKGSLVNPEEPAPVVCGNHETSSRIYDVVVKAIGTISPDLAFGAGEGSSNGFSYMNVESGRMGRNRTVGGLGACRHRDGITKRSAVGNTAVQSFERIEESYPFLTTEEFSIVTDSGGAGRHRGGNSVRRVMRFDEDVRMVLTAERTKTRPFGVEGGRPGQSARYVYVDPEDERTETKSKFDMEMAAGSRFVAVGAGGGGYGPPEERPREAVLDDVENGYVSVEAAKDEYGVVIDPDTTTIDHRATDRRRDEE